MEQLSRFSIEGILWFRFQLHQINFGYKGLPPDVHFTVAFNPNSQNVNLHLSRNVDGVPAELKPRFDIATISKKDLGTFADTIPVTMLNLMLEPFDIGAFKEKHGTEIAFLSHDDIQTEQHPVVKQMLEDGFKKISKRQGNSKIKIHGPIKEVLMDFSTSVEMQEIILNNAKELPDTFERLREAAMLITSEGVIHVIRDENLWYKMREDIRPMKLLQAFLEPALAKRMMAYTKRSIRRIKSANTIADTARYNQGAILFHKKI